MIFETLDNSLRSELPGLLDLRVPYLDPSFECMVRGPSLQLCDTSSTSGLR